jgi:hypothetical protein
MKPRKLSESEKKIIAYSQEWKCGHCMNMLPACYQIDHIVPHSIDGNDDKSNLMALCPTCHSKKTQKENNRISKFKKYRAQYNKNICWFCLEENIKFHNCQKTLKPITKPITQTAETKGALDKFIFVSENSFESSFKKLNIDTTLHIRLTPYFIHVNNFFTQARELTIDNIAEAVFIATRTKKDSNRYTEVEIQIEIRENTPDELVDFIHNNLHKKLVKRIFNPKIEIQYTYIF